jgi:hypothetical protein
MVLVEVVVLGVGAGSTSTYHGECSSSFMVCVKGAPVLMLDVVSSCSTAQGFALLHCNPTDSRA